MIEDPPCDITEAEARRQCILHFFKIWIILYYRAGPENYHTCNSAAGMRG